MNSLETAFFEPSYPIEDGFSYYVIHCKPRLEKNLLLHVTLIPRPCYLPFYTKMMERKAGAGRIRQYESKLPVFPGYLFALLHHDDQKISQLHDGVANFIQVKPSETPHFLHQLGQLALALQSEYTIAPYENFERGSLVKITGGTLKGLEGYVVEHKEKQIFIIQIDLVGRAVSIDIDAGFLKKVH